MVAAAIKVFHRYHGNQSSIDTCHMVAMVTKVLKASCRL